MVKMRDLLKNSILSSEVHIKGVADGHYLVLAFDYNEVETSLKIVKIFKA